MLKKGDIEYLKKYGQERALTKLALASEMFKSVRLSAAEVRQIFASDGALHQRLYDEHEELGDAKPKTAKKGGAK